MRLAYIFLIFFSSWISAFVPQEVLRNAQQLYDVLMKKDQQEITIALAKRDTGIHLFKQARKIAKQKGDVENTQYLTEKILEGQKSIWERYPRLIPAASAAAFFVIGCRLGALNERRLNGSD